MNRFFVSLDCGCWGEFIDSETSASAAKLYVEGFNPPVNETFTIFTRNTVTDHVQLYEASRNVRLVDVIGVPSREPSPKECPHVKLLKQLQKQIEFAIMHVHEGRKAGAL